MREARIILPSVSFDATNYLQKALISLAGGYTKTNVTGCWKDAKGTKVYDTSIAYDVAVQPNAYSMLELRRIAVEAARIAEQEAVYVRDCNGEVNILPVEPDEDAAEALTKAFAVPPAPTAQRPVKEGEVWKTRDGSHVLTVKANPKTRLIRAHIIKLAEASPFGRYDDVDVKSDGRVACNAMITHPLDLASFDCKLD
jgi:hypothetical protein